MSLFRVTPAHRNDTGELSLGKELINVDWRIKPYEMAVLLLGVIYLYFILPRQLPLSVGLARAFFWKIVQLITVVYLIALPITLWKVIYLRVTIGRGALQRKFVQLELLRPYWTLDFFIRSIRRGLATFGAVFLFLHLKHLILWIHHSNFDRALWDIDRLMHFGIQPNVLFMQLLGRNWDASVLLDWFYIKYFTFMIIVCVFFLLELKGKELSDRFFLAYVLVWMLGGLSYLLVPADGPCYAVLYRSAISSSERAHVFQFPVVSGVSGSYASIYKQTKIPTAKHYQKRLWKERKEFLAGKKLPGSFYGIAAMPSLHVAMVVLAAVFLWQAWVPLGAIAWVFAVVTFVGSIFLQWHYAVDGYAGFLMALFISIVVQNFPFRRGRSSRIARRL